MKNYPILLLTALLPAGKGKRLFFLIKAGKIVKKENTNTLDLLLKQRLVLQ
jgi:hypothetical protein